MGLMKEGDEVIVPANTFIATIMAITDNRLNPVLVEPDINTFNLDISLIEQHITSLRGLSWWYISMVRHAGVGNLNKLPINMAF